MKKLLFILLFIPAHTNAQIDLPLALQTPPVGTSHAEMMEFLNQLDAASDIMDMEIGTFSHEQRAIPVLYLPPRRNWSRMNSTIMVFAQQHGNEPSGKEALLMLLHRLHREPMTYDLNLILIPMVNPDGNESRKRENGADQDLNRNHVILTEPEARMLQGIFRAMNPEVTLDVHEYGITSWLDQGYLKHFGEQLDCISNLAIPQEMRAYASQELLQPTIMATRMRGLNSERYLVTRSGIHDMVRHSTTDIDDARNSFGIQYTLSFILEGANGLSQEDRIWERAKHQLTVIENFLKICDDKSASIKTFVSGVRARYATHMQDSVIIQADYTEKVGRELIVSLVSIYDMENRQVTLKDYRPFPEAIVTVKRPNAYVIEKPSPEMLQLLDRQGIMHQPLTGMKTFKVQEFHPSGVDTLYYEGRKTVIPGGAFKTVKKSFSHGDIFIPLNNIRANQIVQIMEPQSFYGLSHYGDYESALAGAVFPIYRVIQ